MAGFESLRDVYRVLSRCPAPGRIPPPSRPPPRKNRLLAGGIHLSSRHPGNGIPIRVHPPPIPELIDSILVQLARDLGEDFHSKYWARTVSLLCVTVNHPDFNVIEAAFNTLSWLLKYLARPLVANLTTTFDQLAPLLGKPRQKQHVRRFASEAFAFLLRRVKSPNEVVEYMMSDLGDNEEYLEAVANVFIEGSKAPGRNLHSKALAIVSALVRSAQSSGMTSSFPF